MIKKKKMGEKNLYSDESGFTLVELLVSMAVLTIVIAVGVSVFMTVSQGAEKARVLEKLRYEGLRIMDQMEREIKRSKYVRAIDTGTLEISLDQEGGTNCIQYTLVTAAEGENSYLTRCEGACPFANPESCPQFTDTSQESGFHVESVNFEVVAPDNRPKNVYINLNLAQNQLLVSRPSDAAQIELKNTVSLRSY